MVGRVGEGVGVNETKERGGRTCRRRAQIQMFSLVWNRNKNKTKQKKKEQNEMKDEQEMKTSPCPVSLGWPLVAREKGQRRDKCPKGSVKVSDEKKKRREEQRRGKAEQSAPGGKAEAIINNCAMEIRDCNPQFLRLLLPRTGHREGERQDEVWPRDAPSPHPLSLWRHHWSESAIANTIFISFLKTIAAQSARTTTRITRITTATTTTTTRRAGTKVTAIIPQNS